MLDKTSYIRHVIAPANPIDMYNHINAWEKKATVLVIDEFRTFYLDKPFIASTLWDHSYWREIIYSTTADDEILSRLKKMSVTHIFRNERYIMEKIGQITIWPWTAETQERSQKFIDENINKVYEEEVIWVVELK